MVKAPLASGFNLLQIRIIVRLLQIQKQIWILASLHSSTQNYRCSIQIFLYKKPNLKLGQQGLSVLRLVRYYLPPKTCMPRSAKTTMKRKSRKSKLIMDFMEFIRDTTRFLRDAQYLNNT